MAAACAGCPPTSVRDEGHEKANRSGHTWQENVSPLTRPEARIRGRRWALEGETPGGGHRLRMCVLVDRLNSQCVLAYHRAGNIHEAVHGAVRVFRYWRIDRAPAIQGVAAVCGLVTRGRPRIGHDKRGCSRNAHNKDCANGKQIMLSLHCRHSSSPAVSVLEQSVRCFIDARYGGSSSNTFSGGRANTALRPRTTIGRSMRIGCATKASSHCSSVRVRPA